MARALSVNVSARMFHAAMVCVSTEDTRYYLNGVHIEPHPDKGAVLVATDGHRMLVCHDEEGRCSRPVIVRVQGKPGRELGVALARASRDDGARMTIDKAGAITVPGGFRATEDTLIDGTFVDWTRLIKPVLAGLRTKTVVHAAFNPRYMAAFAKVANRLQPDNAWPSIRVMSSDEGAAALVLFSASASTFALLMPTRIDVGRALPPFMRPILEPKAGPKASTKAKPKANRA